MLGTYLSTTYLGNHSESTSPACYTAAPGQSPAWQPGTGNWVHRGEACSAVERTMTACRLDLMQHNSSYSHRHAMVAVLVTSQPSWHVPRQLVPKLQRVPKNRPAKSMTATLLNLNGFSKCFNRWKACIKFQHNLYNISHHILRRLLHYRLSSSERILKIG